MKHYRQQLYACFPTAIACYLEKPPELVTVEMVGNDLLDYGWWAITDPRSEIFSLVLS